MTPAPMMALSLPGTHWPEGSGRTQACGPGLTDIGSTGPAETSLQPL